MTRAGGPFTFIVDLSRHAYDSQPSNPSPEYMIDPTVLQMRTQWCRALGPKGLLLMLTAGRQAKAPHIGAPPQGCQQAPMQTYPLLLGITSCTMCPHRRALCAPQTLKPRNTPRPSSSVQLAAPSSPTTPNLIPRTHAPRGDFGRLGHGECGDVFVPRPIDFFEGRRVAAVACGDTHTLVVTEGDGALYTFGRNQNGQLGLGHTHDCLSPQPVLELQVG